MTVLRPAGSHAWLAEIGTPGEVAALAGALRAMRPPRLREIVPGHDTLLLVWDGQRLPAGDVERLLDTARGSPAAAPTRAALTIPVEYDGPDLAAVAATVGCSPEEIVRRHSAPEYRVAFLGFAPGFAYLTGGDPSLALPRRADPRTVVPAGSVAIAGGYSAVYPRAAPGGWHLLGRTGVVLFDPGAAPPSPLVAGMAVRFEPGGGR